MALTGLGDQSIWRLSQTRINGSLIRKIHPKTRQSASVFPHRPNPCDILTGASGPFRQFT
jgi:hypothetical protein